MQNPPKRKSIKQFFFHCFKNRLNTLRGRIFNKITILKINEKNQNHSLSIVTNHFFLVILLTVF
ncbi:hypothetical protein EB008_04155 [bacterium]|nr:hypothetical protein [bacterium]